jgi:hypothetical protein
MVRGEHTEAVCPVIDDEAVVASVRENPVQAFLWGQQSLIVSSGSNEEIVNVARQHDLWTNG